MPPVTRRGYKNEFKHEVKSDPHSLQGRRPRCLQSRPPQCQHPQQLSGLLSPPSGFRPAAAEPAPWPRSSDRGAPYFIYPAQRHRASARAKALLGLLPHPSGFRPGAAELAHRGLDRQIGEHRISSIQLSATAPLREPRPFQVCSLLPQVSAPEPQS